MFKNRILSSKSFFAIMAICILVLPFQISCESKSLSEITEDISYRTVQIVFVQTDGEETKGITSIGTGFLLNNSGGVVTSNRIIEAGDQCIRENESGKMAVVIPAPAIASGNQYSGWVATNDFDIIARDKENSLVLLKIKMGTVISPFNGKKLKEVHYHNHVSGTLNVGDAHFTGSVSQGAPIAITGYTSNEFTTETITGEVTSKEASGIYITDITLSSDLIGSPVYSANNGKIIGMCDIDSSGKITIIPAGFIEKLMYKN